eukprot:COSAG01_NODE_16054_length_1274_cov_1.878298_2_plen_80_part_00
MYAAKWGAVKSPFGNFQYLNPDDEPCGQVGNESSDYCTVPWPLDGDPGAAAAQVIFFFLLVCACGVAVQRGRYLGTQRD